MTAFKKTVSRFLEAWVRAATSLQTSCIILLSSANDRLTVPMTRYMSKVFIFIALLAFWTSTIQADTIAVIGTGDVGSALGPEFAALGHEVIYGSRNPSSEKVVALVQRTGHAAKATKPQEATLRAEIVVLAVPGMLVKEIVAGLGDLSGKIIVDPTNPLVRRDDGKLGIEIDGSNAEIIQAAAPRADVVKAFNTLGWRTMVDPESTGGPELSMTKEDIIRKGYVLRTFSGHEKKVQANLETRARSMHLEDRIFEILIPMEDVVEIKNGKKVTVSKTSEKTIPAVVSTATSAQRISSALTNLSEKLRAR